VPSAKPNRPLLQRSLSLGWSEVALTPSPVCRFSRSSPPFPLAVAAAIVAAFQVRSVTDPQTAAATGCADVMFIGARGSGEPMQVKRNGKLVTYHHGVGAPLDFMAGRLGDVVHDYGEDAVQAIDDAKASARPIRTESCTNRRRSSVGLLASRNSTRLESVASFTVPASHTPRFIGPRDRARD